jgi:RHS repeat-associated protein
MLVAALLILSLSRLCAQVGDNNPTGPAGIFNGQIETGGSYDPYTGNVRRVVTDIVVAGGVGTYPLALTRTYNSRLGGGASFGYSGWRHSYEWGIEDSPEATTANAPVTYVINFPDGRHQTFTTSTVDPNYKRAALGTRERLQALNLSTMLVYLVLPDGGQVEFKATQNSEWDPDLRVTLYWYSYVAQALIDPYGQRTTFTLDGYSRLTKVTEPAGRYLQFTYTSPSGLIVDKVTASDGRVVDYSYISVTFGGYTQWVLDHIVYYGNNTWMAHYAYQGPNVGPAYAGALLKTCDDPMYPGPMKKIGYTYRTANNPDGTAAVYGQISSENYYDGTNIGAAVSTVSVTTSTTRTETRGDERTRGFTYNAAGYLTWCSDFKGFYAQQGYDTNMYVNSVTDRNGNTTNYTNNALTGVVTQIQYPLTQSDTPGQSVRPTVNYSYTGTNCSSDTVNPYHVCSATDEGGHVTTFYRNGNKQLTWIINADGGTESFAYNSFGELTSHKRRTNGYDNYTYDARGLKTDYRTPANPTGNATARYQYEGHDWVKGVTDALGSSSGDVAHTTSFSYDVRGQVTIVTRPTDPVDNARHNLQKIYNADGTLQYTLDEMNHRTDYTYDDYKRVKTIMTPQRFYGDNTPRTTYFYYDANGTTNDYTDTNSQPTWITLPGGQRTKNTYDENFRKLSTTVGYGTSDAATTSCTYDNVGNQTKVLTPNQQSGQIYYGDSTVTAYDARNRVQSITDALSNPTSFQYDLAGRKYRITRPNGQTLTYESYDTMNRLLQQRATQTPEPDAVTKYTYTTTDLLSTMQDPRLVQINSTDKYTYNYDPMGRKTQLTYPGGKTETWDYDEAGRMDQFTNRNGKIQTFTYDALNRCTGFSWNDGGVTPSATFGYDTASRLISADNVNATIDYVYFNDNLLQSETERITGSGYWGTAISYTYDANGNRASDDWPDSGGQETHTYTYTNRNQLKTYSLEGSVLATYAYDLNGNLASRTDSNTASSTYTYDELDRVEHIGHALVGVTKTFDYDYDSVGNRLHVDRDGSYTGDAFAYDLAGQVTAVQLNVQGIWNVHPTPTIVYDANGNRTSFGAYGTTDSYGAVNNLNQYTTRTITGNTITAAHDNNGNMTNGLDTSSYTFDAQNRIISASKNGTSAMYYYDALNRQVIRYVNSVRSDTIYDGWNAIIQYGATNNWTNASWYGPDGVFAEMNGVTWSIHFCYHDASGSTTALADNTGLLEWYRYDLDGTPLIYAPDGSTRTDGTHYDNRHYFTGQLWYSDLGLYDLRNRFYSPDIGRFLQPDPIDFEGDPTNLYRYGGNNPVNAADPLGLWQVTFFGGAGLGVYITFGHNSGQWNFGGYGGYGTGAVFSINGFDQGYHAEGQYFGCLAAAGHGEGPVGAGATAYIGQGGNWGTIAVRVGLPQAAINGGFKYNQDGMKSTGAGVVFGQGGFVGTGYNVYLDDAPQPPMAIPGARDIIYYNRDGKAVAMTPGPVEVVAPPVYQRGSSGGPSWGNGVGIFDTTGFNAPYVSNFYGYTGSLPTTLSNPWGSWGKPATTPNGDLIGGLTPVPGGTTIGEGFSPGEAGISPRMPADLR